MSATQHKLIERARAIAPDLAAEAGAIEAGRRVPRALANRLAELGMFRMLVPEKLRGFEAHPTVLVRVLSELARGDAACAWHVMTGATNGLLSAYLPVEAAVALWGEDPQLITAGVFAPMGRARAVDDGYRVSGRWPFASGCQNASWLMGGAMVVNEDGATKRPEMRSFLFPADGVQVIDTWDVAGLCGTGSHHIEIDDVLVPAHHSCSLLVDAPRHEGVLYRFPVFGLLAAGVAAVGLGIARAAIDAFVDLARGKKPLGSGHTLAEQDIAQRELARAEGELRSGEALLLSTVADAYEAAEDGPLSLSTRALVRLAALEATRHAVRAVDAMYHLGGGTALYRTSSLQRHFRDMHAVTQHVMVSHHIERTVGRVLMGVETDTSQL